MTIMLDNNLATNLELYTYICTLKKEVDIESHIVDIFGQELDRLLAQRINWQDSVELASLEKEALGSRHSSAANLNSIFSL